MASAWLDGYFTINVANGSTPPTLVRFDFRMLGRSTFIGIQTFCRFFFVVTTSAQSVFGADEFISSAAMSRKFNITIFKVHGAKAEEREGILCF